MTDDPSVLVSTGWLAERLEAPGLTVLDGSWYLPDMGRDAVAEYRAAHIPGARFFDIEAVSDASSGLPHTVPTAAMFAAACRDLGVRGDGQVVVYDGMGLFSAARVWWLLRHMGHARVAVLDGGLPKWRAEGREVSDAVPPSGGGDLTPARDAALIADTGQVAAGDAQIVDARPAARFRGDAPEPREGLRAGHIPGSHNLFFGDLIAPDGTMKSEPELHAAFRAAGVDPARPVITTCGSGVTAAILSLALARIGHADHALYDGSWSEWGLDPALPIETGER